MDKSVKKINTILRKLGGATKVAADLSTLYRIDIDRQLVLNWSLRGSIPVEWWPGLVALAAANRLPPWLTYDALVALHGRYPPSPRARRPSKNK